MKVVTWNCNGAFRNKLHALEDIGADILVIQECEDPARSTIKYLEWASDYFGWVLIKTKELGCFQKMAMNWKH